MKLTLGFSPCPNDTFLFDAMIHKKIDVEGLEFDVIITDVEDLNKKSLNHELDISKLSFHAFMHCYKSYILLNTGGALGENCGPLLISRDRNHTPSINDVVAIPGRFTTANLLMKIILPEVNKRKEMIFSDIERNVISGDVDLGVIIHESRFTYRSKGLYKILDLGEYWQQITSLPIPLGGIVIKRSFNKLIQKKFQRVLRRSIDFALNNPESSYQFISSNSQEISREVIKSHIDLYVNKFSVNFGVEGKRSIIELFQRMNMQSEDLFLED